MTDPQESLSPERIAEWEALAAKASPAPWTVKREDIGDEHVCIVPIEILSHGTKIVAYEGGLSGRDGPWTIEQIEADAALMTEARTAVPALAAEVTALRERVAELEAALLETQSACEKVREFGRSDEYRWGANQCVIDVGNVVLEALAGRGGR